MSRWDSMDGMLTDKQYAVISCVAINKNKKRGWWCLAQLQYFARENAKHCTDPEDVVRFRNLVRSSDGAWKKCIDRLLYRGLIEERYRDDFATHQFKLTDSGRAAITAYEKRQRELLAA